VGHLEGDDTVRIVYSSEEQRQLFGRYPDVFKPSRPFICEIEDCDIVGPKAVALSDGRVIMDTVHLPRFDLNVLKEVGKSDIETSVLLDFLRALSGRPKTEELFESEYVFPLVSQDVSYYHWIVEYLPKLRLLERYQTRTGHRPTILIEPSPRDYVVESLELAGYGSNRYKQSKSVCQRAETLVVPSHRNYTLNRHLPDRSAYDPSMSDLTWLRSRMRSKVGADSTGDSGERIYVSRQQTGSNRGRRVVNYRELMDFLSERGFTSYALETLPFKKQVELFSDAQIIVGPHGAGLANMLFADDPTVVELFPNDKQEPYFYHMANMFGFDYTPVVADTKGNDLVVDVSSLQTRFDELRI